MKRQILLSVAALAMTLWAQPVSAEPVTDAVAKANLAKVPAHDPVATSAPQLLDSMRGQHPRLLFTQSEIEKLKQQIATDPILKRTYTDCATWAKRFNLAKAWQPQAIFRDDTPAIVMTKSWPALAYVYAIDRDPNVKQGIIDILNMMLKEPYWANAAELDSNMGAAQNMLVAGILFDVIYNDLDPTFRAQMAEKILTHVRRMHYLGYQKLSLMPIKYWQNDPAANHRWHRGAGMTASLLAIADEKNLDTGYLLQQLKNEIDFLVKWYPVDGDCHEGAGYQQFGFFYLAIASKMMDRNLGTSYLKAPGFKSAWAQQIYYSAPGRQSDISFGDDMNGELVFDNLHGAFFISPSLSRDKNVQAALLAYLQKFGRNPKFPERAFSYPWSLLAFYDPTVGSGDAKALPTHRLFHDLGAASMRDSWDDKAVCMTFKCGPYGGYALNEYAQSNKDANGKPCYINIAHDDPDANTFAIGMAGEFIFHPGLYSFNKITASQSGITIDGKGQINEGSDYTQPVPGVDMRTLSYLTAWKTDTHGRVVIEGEAAKAYPNNSLKRFRRTAIFMPGDYALLLDDVRANGTHQIMWRGTVEKAQFEDPASGRCYVSTKKGQRVDFQILADRDFKGSIDYVYLDGRFGSSLMNQFQFFTDTAEVRFACVLDLWKKKPMMTLKESGDLVALTVKMGAAEDTWTWKRAMDDTSPSVISCKRNGQEIIALQAADKLEPLAHKQD